MEKSGHSIFLITLLMIFVAEFGDKTQKEGLHEGLVQASKHRDGLLRSQGRFSNFVTLPALSLYC